MHENELTRGIIGAAIEVHRWLGPGLLEAVYEETLRHELHLRDVPFTRQQRVPINYKGARLAADLRLDLLVSDRIIVDVKSKENLAPTNKPQILTYLRLCNLHIGLIINFHMAVLKQGVFRVINGYEGGHPRSEEPPDFRATVIQ